MLALGELASNLLLSTRRLSLVIMILIMMVMRRCIRIL